MGIRYMTSNIGTSKITCHFQLAYCLVFLCHGYPHHGLILSLHQLHYLNSVFCTIITKSILLIAQPGFSKLNLSGHKNVGCHSWTPENATCAWFLSILFSHRLRSGML